MNDPASRERTDPLRGILVAVAMALVAAVLYEWAAFMQSSRTAQSVLSELSSPGQAAAGDVQKRVAADKSLAADLKKKNLFKLPEPPRNPVTEVAGILGNEALINGQWYKAGAKMGEGKNQAVVVSVDSTKVKVKWNGQETDFLPINSSGQASASGPPSGGPGGGPPRPAGMEGRRGGSVVMRSEATPLRGTGGQSGGPSAEEMRAYQERMRNASSPEEQRRISEEMRQKFSGR
jgi:hypothetical protein